MWINSTDLLLFLLPESQEEEDQCGEARGLRCGRDIAFGGATGGGATPAEGRGEG